MAFCSCKRINRYCHFSKEIKFVVYTLARCLSAPTSKTSNKRGEGWTSLYVETETSPLRLLFLSVSLFRSFCHYNFSNFPFFSPIKSFFVDDDDDSNYDNDDEVRGVGEKIIKIKGEFHKRRRWIVLWRGEKKKIQNGRLFLNIGSPLPPATVAFRKRDDWLRIIFSSRYCY